MFQDISTFRRRAALAMAMALPAMAAWLPVARAQAMADAPLYVGRLEPFRGKTAEQKLQELADREEIRELIAVYAHRVAHGLSIADLFTEDGVFINHRSPQGPTSEAHGQKELQARFADRPGHEGESMPMLHNYILSIHGDEARGTSSNELRITENGQSMIASGYYEDKLRRVNGRWLFARREITFFHWVPIQEGWARPAGPK